LSSDETELARNPAAYLDPDVIPLAWSQVTAEWMTAALQSRLPGARVERAVLATHDDGTNRRARFRLSYAEGSGPETVFLKAHAADNRVTHLRNGNLWNEARLFASGVDLPVDHPLVYKSVVDLLGLDFLLVMEDIRQRGGDPRDSTRPMTPRQAANGVRALARLHSRYWGVSPATHPKLAWLQTWAPTEGWKSGLRRFVPGGMQRGQDLLPEAVARYAADEVVELWGRYVATLGRDPVTMTHGDLHIGNTYVLPDDEVGFLDWQVARRGAWHQDLGHFLGSALSKEDRRAHERELVEMHRTALEVPKGDLPSAEEAWTTYRTTPIYGLTIWLSTLGTDGWQPHEISRALVDRFAAAFVELGALAALDAVGA
jgi:aminoglycoside phosphotransferase (APT) family kinase protein